MLKRFGLIIAFVSFDQISNLADKKLAKVKVMIQIKAIKILCKQAQDKLTAFNLMNNKKTSAIVGVFIFVFSFNASALEGSVELHKPIDEGTYGFSLGITDSFFKQKAFNWKVSYNQFDDVNAQWNGKDYDMSLKTTDLLLTYRYFPKSYNKFLNKLTFEVQAGAAVSLTDSLLIFPEEEGLDDIVLSEAGDVTGVAALLVYYKMTKSTSFHIGVKHYPSYSEYGDVSSVFLGFDYHFGRQINY